MAKRKKSTKAAELATAAMLQEPMAITPAPSSASVTTVAQVSSDPGGKPPTAGVVIEPAEVDQPATPIAEHAGSPPEATKTAGVSLYAADPRPTMSVNLCGYSGGPAVHLLRSHRFRQMQIRFDQGQPDERHLAMLKRSGWTDRTESEGIWTKQIDPNARWQSVDRMEQEFKAMANAIRKERGLAPALERLVRA